MRVDKPMLAPDGTECCGTPEWCFQHCEYHRGYLDALDREEAADAALITRCEVLQARIQSLEDRYTAEVTESERWNALYLQELGRTRTLRAAGDNLAEAAAYDLRKGSQPLARSALAGALVTWEQAVKPT